MGEEIPRRKPTRLSHYDYGRSGAYFITICTHEKRCTLSRIVGEGLAPPAVHLSKYGMIAETQLHLLYDRFPAIHRMRYVIMPNHIHILLTICREAGGASPSPTASQIVGAFKSLTTRECNRQYGTVKIFQRSFHDHIIRDRDDYIRIAKYIAENPKLWHRDCFYTPS